MTTSRQAPAAPGWMRAAATAGYGSGSAGMAAVAGYGAQPALRARVPGLVAFFAGFFFVATFFVAFFVATFFAGVRVLSPRLFCSRATKSTTLVVASSLVAGSSSTWVVAPLSLMRLRMISDRRSRNSLRYASGFHSVAMESTSWVAISSSFALIR